MGGGSPKALLLWDLIAGVYWPLVPDNKNNDHPGTGPGPRALAQNSKAPCPRSWFLWSTWVIWHPSMQMPIWSDCRWEMGKRQELCSGILPITTNTLSLWSEATMQSVFLRDWQGGHTGVLLRVLVLCHITLLYTSSGYPSGPSS